MKWDCATEWDGSSLLNTSALRCSKLLGYRGFYLNGADSLLDYFRPPFSVEVLSPSIWPCFFFLWMSCSWNKQWLLFSSPSRIVTSGDASLSVLCPELWKFSGVFLGVGFFWCLPRICQLLSNTVLLSDQLWVRLSLMPQFWRGLTLGEKKQFPREPNSSWTVALGGGEKYLPFFSNLYMLTQSVTSLILTS